MRFRRDEGDGLVGGFQGLAQEEGGEEGFLAFVFRLDEAEAAEGLRDEIVGACGRREVGEAFGPVARFGGGGEGFVEEAAARCFAGRLFAVGPGVDVGGFEAEPF